MSQRIVALLRAHWPLLLALGVGLALRMTLWGRLPRTGLIGDEAEYLAAGDWLALGRGFAWHTQYFWTRAPLYPLFLAAHITVFGRVNGPIFVTQSLLSLVNVGLVYALGRQVSGSKRAAGLAALGTALYLPLASYGQLLLSETLFISLLLSALLALGQWAGQVQLRATGEQPAVGRGGAAVYPSPGSERIVPANADEGGTPSLPGLRDAPNAEHVRSEGRAAPVLIGAAGVLLGLATLTRGLTLGFVPLACLWMLGVAMGAGGQRRLRSAAGAGVLLLAWGLTVFPWTIYASRTYGGPVLVDTTGSFNLLFGARTAFDGERDDAATRNFVLALLPIPGRSQDERTALLAPRRAADGGLERAGSCLYAAGDPQLLAALERPPAALSQAERQQLMSAEALCLLRARPLAFAQKSLVELIDLFRINYTGAERLTRGFALGHVPPWYTLTLLLLDDTLYVLALPLAVLGWAVLRTAGGPQDARAGTALSLLIGLWLLYNLTTAPLLFAINRFRVPLMPFVFLLAGAALAAWPRLGATLRASYGAACAVLASLLLLVAAAPHAYLEPRAPGAPSTWASYFGPYPSSLASSRIALQTRPGFAAEQRLAAALGAGDAAAARAALADPRLPGYSAAMGAPLLDGLEGRPAAGLERLASSPVRPLEPWQTSVVAGELLRQLGEIEAARREFGPELVDSQNPVSWAWNWLAPPPPPVGRIAVADDNDLGYINGFYLGGYDTTLAATLRWASGHSALRFPGAGNGAPRQLCLRLGGAWPTDLALPEIGVSLDGDRLGAIALQRELREVCLALPARPPGADYRVALHAPTFVPDALDLIAQQGPQTGQLRLLAYQLDWAEVR